MTLSHRGDATRPLQPQQRPGIDLALASQEQRREKTVSSPENDGQTIASKRAESQNKRNKQSLDYVLRTGLAGGLAGCAVSLSFFFKSLRQQTFVNNNSVVNQPSSSLRPKPWLAPLIASRSFSRPRTRSLQNTLVRGSAQ